MNKILLAVGVAGVGLVALLGLYLFIKGARNLRMAAASTGWPTTQGAIASSDTTREVTESTSDETSVTFNTRTVIQYSVNGQQYSTDVLHFGQTLGSSDKSDAALKKLRYPVGKPVPVSYNPSDPSIAVMKPGLHAEAFWLPGAALAFLLPAVLCLIMAPAIRRAMRAFSTPVQPFDVEAFRRGENPPPPQPGGDAGLAIAATVFGAIACGLGILALTAGMQRYWRGSASETWPTTPGTIIVSGADEPDDTSDSAAKARLVYQYEVAGTKHFNNLRRFAEVEDGSVRYPKNAVVKVSYFPTDPDIAVLEPGNTADALWLPGIGIVLILFSLAIFIWMVPKLAK
ncbi:MAG TPA: DUF3592 domain-containing protein [Bryobacteraceae bacterium]|jgi:hypothetical protein|nr:DUF3592 domain-containing protein [Bryobacteraceae bacterium]